jgi:coenzyme PQQ precursor peptide PqqA
MTRSHIPIAEFGRPFGFASLTGRTDHCLVSNSRKEKIMREWHKPTIEETESGMEVTSYLPAELDRV